MHGKLNEHQYNFIGSSLSTTNGDSSNSRLTNSAAANPLFMRAARFLTSLDTDLLHSRVLAVSLQALAALALNSEESRRVIGGEGGLGANSSSSSMMTSMMSSGSDLVARLIELIEADASSLPTHEDDDADYIKDIDDDEDEEEEEEKMDTLGGTERVVIESDDDFRSTTTHTTRRHNQQQQQHVLADATLLKLSALSLLHSLSRSVHQLRTKFLDIKLTNSVSYLIRRVKMQKDALNEQLNKRPANVMTSNRQGGAVVDTEMSDESTSGGGGGSGPRTDDYNRIDFSMNEQTFISLLLAILANMLIDFSPCKEVGIVLTLLIE